MRQIVYIVWIDDDNSPSLKGLMNLVQRYVEGKGYLAKIIYFPSILKADAYFAYPKNKVDLFMIDYNIGGPNSLSGFDYLSKVRKDGKYRQYFILYSNNGEEVLKDELSVHIKHKDLSDLTNFEVISLENIDEKEKRFEKAIDVALSWWDELNAIRGILTSLNGKFDFFGRKLLSISPSYSNIDWFNLDKNTYKKVIRKCKAVCNANRIFEISKTLKLFKSWNDLRLLRNTFAHGVERFDESLQKYYIENPLSNDKIFSHELNSYRQEIFRLSKDVESIIDEMKKFFSCTLPDLI